MLEPRYMVRVWWSSENEAWNYALTMAPEYDLPASRQNFVQVGLRSAPEAFLAAHAAAARILHETGQAQALLRSLEREPHLHQVEFGSPF